MAAPQTQTHVCSGLKGEFTWNLCWNTILCVKFCALVNEQNMRRCAIVFVVMESLGRINRFVFVYTLWWHGIDFDYFERIGGGLSLHTVGGHTFCSGRGTSGAVLISTC